MKIKNPKDIAPLIDHTLLKATANSEQIETLCKEANTYQFASVCINPVFVPLASTILKDSPVKVCTVIGFPLGANLIETKKNEAIDCLKAGAKELDMVINISKLIEKDYDYINREISTIMASLSSDIIFKLIIETCYLSDETIIDICNIAVNNGVHFVKTSTGFGSSGANTKVVTLMKKTVGENAKIKASGGIRDFETAISMIKCGATRLGTSSGIKIIGENL